MSRKPTFEEAAKIMLAANLQPLEDFKGGDYPWLCKCLKCNREVSPRFKGVRDRGSGCKYCAGNAVVPSEALNEMIAKGLKPLVEFPGASKPWKAECKTCKSITSPRLADLRMGGSGCKKCADERGGKKRRLDNNPIRAGKTTQFDEVLAVMQNAYLEPLEPYTSSQNKWKCKCLKCGALVSPRYHSIKSGYGGCMNCSRIQAIGRGRLDESAAVAIMRGKNLEPLEPYPGSMVPWRVECLDCGNQANPTYAHIQQGRKGCKHCGYKKNADSQRTSQEEAFRIARAAGFEPREPYRGRHLPWKCKCMKCGIEIAPHYSGILSGGGCRYCAGLVVDPNEATNVMKKMKLQPLVPYPGAGVPWLCKCLKCEKEIKPRYSTVNKGIGGCKYCATRGYDFSKGGILYLITNQELNAHKIGITNEDAKEKRIAKHIKEGWNVYQTRYFLDGNTAFEIEQEILLWWRIELGLPIYLSKIEMPQGGFTETIDAAEIDLITIWNRVQQASKEVRKIVRQAQLRKTSMPTRKK